MTQSRAFEVLTASRLAAVRATLEERLQAWCTEWRPLAPVGGALTVQAHAPGYAGHGSRGWLAGAADGPCAWVPASARGTLAAWLFNSDEAALAQDDVAAEVAQAALAQLLHAWLGTQGPVHEAPLPACAGQAGMPVVSVTVPLGTRGLQAVMRLAEAPDAATRPRQGVEPKALKAALQRQPVTISADLGDVELDLQALHSLAAGDVIRFDTALDQPLRLRVDGRRLDDGPRAYLGTLDGHRALEIVNHRNAT